MNELAEYRMKLIDRLAAGAQEFRSACLAARDARAPLEAGEWSIHQIAAHTRDVARLVYGWRARRTAVENNPEFENFDGEAYMAAHYSADEPLEQILNELVDEVESLAGMLRELTPEAWARQSSHIMLGRGITLQTWVEKGLSHIEEHLRTLKGLNS